MSKLYFSLILVILSISIASAFSFDNRAYDTTDYPNIIKSEKDIWNIYPNQKIKNAFGLGSDLEILSIDEHEEYCVNECESIIAVNHLVDNSPIIDDIKFYRLHDNKKEEINIDYTLSYKSSTDKQFREYSVNQPLPSGEYLIKILGNKKSSDNVDWIITSQGVELSRWAVWGATNLTKDTQAYWKFDETSGSQYTDTLGNYNLTSLSVNSANSWVINGSYKTQSDPGTVTSLIPQSTWQGITINFWMNKTGAWSTYYPFFYLSDSASPNEMGELFIRDDSDSSDDNLIISAYDSSLKSVTTIDFADNKWYMITVTVNSSSLSVYVNGTHKQTTALSSFALSSGESVKILTDEGGTESLTNTNIDEYGIWNRSLTQAEITLLYNSHQGNSYPYANIVSLLKPNDNQVVNYNNVTFNASVSLSESSIKNVSLWINSTGTFRINQTKTYSGTLNTSIFSVNLSQGSYIWNIYACANDNTCAFAQSNRTIRIDTTKPSIDIIYPNGPIDYGYVGKNTSLLFYVNELNKDTCWFEYNNTNSTISCTQNTTFLLSDYSKKTLRLYVNDSGGNFNYSIFNWTYNVFENNFIYNASTFETKYESFILNISSDNVTSLSSSATLFYNGSTYTGTRTTNNGNYLYTTSIDIPLFSSLSNSSVFYGLAITNTSGVYYYNSTYKNQTVSPITFQICNTTLNSTYLNFTFADELTDTSLNASLGYSSFNYWLGSGTIKDSYSYSNATANSKYSFCFSPSNYLLNIDIDLQYESSIYSPVYPIRQYSTQNLYSNSTTNQKLYLLNNGIFVTFQVINSGGSPISDVSVSALTSIFGSNLTVASGTTDSAGGVTFYLNPNADHTITATKLGSGSATLNIRPTQSLYTIILSGASNFTSYISSIEGIYWTRGPSVGLIEPGLTDFYFNVSSFLENIANCKIELWNETSVLSSSSGAAQTNSSCYITNNYNVVFGQTIRGYYYVDLGDGEGYRLLENDGKWYTLYNESAVSPFSFKFIFKNFGENTAWGGNNTEEDIKKFEFSKFVLLFFIIAIIAAALNIYTNFDIAQPGIFLMGFPLIIWFLTIAGWTGTGNGFLYIKGATSFDFLDHIIIALFSTAISIAMTLRVYRGQTT